MAKTHRETVVKALDEECQGPLGFDEVKKRVAKIGLVLFRRELGWHKL
jgi:hypothetical protein